MRLAYVIALLLLAAGCKQAVVEPYDPVSYKDGIIFERPDPYLQVDPSGAAAIVYLPDPNERYVIRVEGLFGDVNLNPAFQNGWMLSSIASSTGNEATMESAIQALGGAGSKMMMLAPRVNLASGLYHIVLRPGAAPELRGPIKAKQ